MTRPIPASLIFASLALSVFVTACGEKSDDTKKSDENPASSTAQVGDDSLKKVSVPPTTAASNVVARKNTEPVSMGEVEPFEPLRLISEMEAGYSDIKDLKFMPKGTTFVVGGDTPAIRKQDHGEPVHAFEGMYPLTGTVVEADTVDISHDGASIALGSGDGRVKIIDAETREIKKDLEAHSQGVVSVCFSPDGKQLASSSYDGKVRVWDTGTFEMVREIDTGEDRAVHTIYAHDGKVLVSAGENAVVWDASTGDRIGDLNIGDDRVMRIMALGCSPDGEFIGTGEANADFENGILIWSAESRKQIATLKHEFGVSAMAFSPDGKLVASSSMDGKVRIWRLADQELVQTIEDENIGSFDQLAWRGDSKVLVLGSMGTLYFWGP